MYDRLFHFVAYLLLGSLGAVIVSSACRSEKSSEPENLVLVKAPASGKISRIFVAEGTDVEEKASLIEITAAPDVAALAANRQKESSAIENIQSEIKASEERLQRASVELQRIEPLVAANSAPQSHLDAARAEYQQAQEHLDDLRRRMLEVPLQNSSARAGNIATQGSTAKVTVVAAPAAGNVRVISVRVGRSVKTGDPLATISANR